MESQGSFSMANYSHSSCISRRSVDWRDSGIVIDDEQQFNSIDAICDFNSSTSRSSCCPLERIVIDQDDDGDTILHLAVVGCTLDKVKDLIKICDLDAINNMMQTPLHVATMANRPDMVQQLISSGARIDIHDRRGNTPLHLACQKGLKEVASIILNNNNNTVSTNSSISNISSSVNGEKLHQLTVKNFDGQTCLHLAASHDRREIIELLVNQFDADLNCQDSRSGETIMHKAIGNFNVDLVDFILKLDKHCNQADYSGRRPLDSIRILLESRLDKRTSLNIMEKLINDRIRTCIEQNGCCVQAAQQQSSRYQISENDMLDISSSSSDYSDSDSDMS